MRDVSARKWTATGRRESDLEATASLSSFRRKPCQVLLAKVVSIIALVGVGQCAGDGEAIGPAQARGWARVRGRCGCLVPGRDGLSVGKGRGGGDARETSVADQRFLTTVRRAVSRARYKMEPKF